MKSKIKHLPRALRSRGVTQRNFLAWLYSQPAGRTFDIRHARRCPLYAFITESRGFTTMTSIWYESVTIDGDWTKEVSISGTWAERFQRLAARRVKVTTMTCIVDLFRATRRRALSLY